MKLEDLQQLVGCCPVCGRKPTWFNDLPLTAFCFGESEDNQHHEMRCLVPEKGKQPNWFSPETLVHDPKGEENDFLMLGKGFWVEKKNLLIHIYDANDEGLCVVVYNKNKHAEGDDEILDELAVMYEDAEELEF